MSIRGFIWSVAIVTLSVPLLAQPSPSGFNRNFCVKVKPGKDADFHAAMKDDLKMLRYEVKSGMLSGAIALQAVVPEGAAAKCDYTFVDFYPGLPPAPQGEAQLTADLQKAGVDKTADQFMEELETSGTLVSSNIDHAVVDVGTTKKGDYVVVNSMRVPDMGAWVREEKKMWKPIFDDGVKSGAVAGWVVVERFMPRGAKDPDVTYTVDIYPSWDSLFSFFGPDFPNRWKKIHPDVPIQQGMQQNDKVSTIEHTVLYKVVADVQK